MSRPHADVRTTRAFCSSDSIGTPPVQRREGLATATSAQSPALPGPGRHIFPRERECGLCARARPARVTVKINPKQGTRTDRQRASYTRRFNGCFHKCMNNLNYHCRAFIRVFRGKMPRLFAPSILFIFVSSLLCAAGLFPCHRSRGTMGCGGAGAPKNAALVAMSCLTLINEGADTGRICESRGGARGPRAPRRRAGAGSEKATATAPRPVGKGRGGRAGPEATSARDGHGKGSRSPASAGQRDGESRPPSWGHGRAAHLPTPACCQPLKRSAPSQGCGRGLAGMTQLMGHGCRAPRRPHRTHFRRQTVFPTCLWSPSKPPPELRADQWKEQVSTRDGSCVFWFFETDFD